MSLALCSGFFFKHCPTPEVYTFPYTTLFRSENVGYGLRVAKLPKEEIIARVQQAMISSFGNRSEEHTSELQSLTNLVCRLLLEKKKLPLTTYSTLPYNVARIDAYHRSVVSQR